LCPHNEERALRSRSQRSKLSSRATSFPYEWKIIIGDNASIDETPAVGRMLEDKSGGQVEYVRIERKAAGSR
jgi:hypothetical protein